MDLASRLALQKEQRRDLPLADRAKLACALAKQLEKAGEYEQAREALEEFWFTDKEDPNVQDLPPEIAAYVTLRVGSLTGSIGSAEQAEGSQERAKDLISRSLSEFERLGRSEGVAEAFADLAICYWREGALDEARINLEASLQNLTDNNAELKAVVLIRAGMVEIAAHHLSEALRIFNECSPLVDSIEDDAIKGTFHNLFAVLFRRLSRAENRDDYLDRALIEYAAAAVHFEQAGNVRYQACVDINLGFLFYTLGRYSEAHTHLDRARDLFIALSDSVHLAQVNDTRAQTLIAEGRLTEAEQFSRSAKKTLEKGDERGLLAEALTTYGRVLARMGKQPTARIHLQRAVEIAEQAGDLEGAGKACLTLIEELGNQTSPQELVSAYRSAINFLKKCDDPSSRNRLISCSEILLGAVPELVANDRQRRDHSWEGFSLKKYLFDREQVVIERALRDSDGSVTHASRLLGFKHHQSLISLLNTRHRELMEHRSAVRKRRRRIVAKPKRLHKRVRRPHSKPTTSQVSILLVEDHSVVAGTITEMLAEQDWRVEVCPNGATALLKLTASDPYDMLITDNNLPGLKGLDLVERVRKITHRRRMPIIMISGDDIEKAAWRAGANEFLRKPEKMDRIANTVERLLTAMKEQPEPR
jgi:CheY-like chemotaxis protein